MNTRIDALATNFFNAIAAGAIASVECLYTDNVPVWHNLPNTAQNETKILRVLRAIFHP